MSLVDKANLIKEQFGLPMDTPLPATVAAAAAQLHIAIDGFALQQQVDACCEALFGSASASPPPAAAASHGGASRASIEVSDTPSSAATHSLLKPAASGPSSAHRVTHRALLRAYLVELALQRMVARLDAAEDASFEGARQGAAWYAEHARAQLSPSSGCESQPAWVAWMSDATSANLAESLDDSGGAVEIPEPVGAPNPAASTAPRRLVELWAADDRAARRALLELELGRPGDGGTAIDIEVLAHASVRPGAHVGVGAAYVSQLRRWAYEHDEYSLHVHRETRTEVAASLQAARTAEERQDRSQARAAGAADDEAVALAKLQALSKRLLELDAHATMDVAPCAERPGAYTLERVVFSGHLMEFAAVVDRHSCIDDLMRVATASCTCCGS